MAEISIKLKSCDKDKHTYEITTTWKAEYNQEAYELACKDIDNFIEELRATKNTTITTA